MEAVVLYRVELELVKDGGVCLTVVKGDVDDVGIGGLEQSFEILLHHGEKDVLESKSIEIARNQSFLAESLDDGFVANLTGLAFQFKMLHFV